MESLSWSVDDLWNSSIIKADRPLVKRDYEWASSLGYPMIDRFLKMNAVPVTNRPTLRALRKFEAGNVYEFLVRFVLQRAGIILDRQQEIWTNYPGLLRVKGKLDFLAGGKPNFEMAKRDVRALCLPPSIEASSLYIVEKLRDKYGDQSLKEIIIEVKSCSTFVMDKLDVIKRPLPQHSSQCFHYLKGLQMDEGHVLYVCKDDLRLLEFGVWNPDKAKSSDPQEEYSNEPEHIYLNDISKLTSYVQNGERPPLEEEILWEPDHSRFNKNIGIEYSNYLTYLYGYKDLDEYKAATAPKISRWNRVLDRYAKGDKLTDKNKEVMEEIVKGGWDFDGLVSQVKDRLR